MTTLPIHKRDIIHRYVVGRESLRQIGARYGVSGEAVRLQLKVAGVELRGRNEVASTHALQWRNSNQARAERRSPRPTEARTAAAQEDEDARAKSDRRHVGAVVKALGGKGLPFYPATELRI